MSSSTVQGVLACMFLVIAICTFLLQGKQWPTFISAVLFGMFFGGNRDNNHGPGIIGSIAMMILAPFGAMLVQMAISRTREYQADASGAQLTGDPVALAGALRKLELGTKQLPLPPEPRIETASHMMIANPFRPGQGFSKMFSTHPPMSERIARLEKMAGRPQ